MVQEVTIYSSRRCEKRFDKLFNVDFSWPDTHKKPNCNYINDYVMNGDTVVVIGGGYGISSTTAAKKVGKGGKVLIYEGTEEVVEDLNTTLHINNVANQCHIEHAIVGDTANLKGAKGKARKVHPSDIPSCDLIEMDCEGAEIDLIPNLPTNISTIIVETHPSKGANTVEVEKLLNSQGWQVVESSPDRSSGDILVATN